jgi:putative ABC transport system permease protein
MVWIRDARFGLRLLRKNPGFTAVAVLALALGIAANTAIFSVVYATLLAPLPYPAPDQLVMVWSRVQDNRNVSAAGTFLEWKRQPPRFNSSVRGPAARSTSPPTSGRAAAAAATTPRFLSMIGYPFELGRDFLEEEGTVGKDHVVILTNVTWRERFGSDRSIVGRQLRINGLLHRRGSACSRPGDRIQNKCTCRCPSNPSR